MPDLASFDSDGFTLNWSDADKSTGDNMSQLTEQEAAIWRDLFDLWRLSYNDWPYKSHQRFYNMVARHFPDQKKYDAERVLDALTCVLAAKGRRLRVWELGGWDGACAKEMIEGCGDGIERWVNTEICSSVLVDKRDEVYIPQFPNYWAWELPSTSVTSYDIAIMSHVIEHLSWDHLRQCLKMLQDVPFLYIQTPASLGDEPRVDGWMRSISTHILSVGWYRIYEYLDGLGYELLWRKDQSRFFGKR